MARRVYWGVALLLVGLLLLASNLGYIRPFSVWGLWPILVIWPTLELFFGRAVVFSRGQVRRVRVRLGGGQGLSLFGIWVLGGAVAELLHNLHLIPFDWGDIAYWTLPMLLVGVGLAIMFRPRRRLFEWERADTGGRTWAASGTTAIVGDLRYGARPWIFKSPMRIGLTVGDLDMDLTTAQFAPGDNYLTVRCWAGDISIRVPEDAEVEVDARCSAGELRIFDDYRDGVGLELRVRRPGGQVLGDQVRLHIGIDITFGDVRVR